jgi:flagellar biosynthesis chaperone FliJ
MKLPINFEQFSKDPVKGLLFLVILSVGYLYADNKMNYQGQIENCGVEVQKLTTKIDMLEERLRKSDSTLARASVKLELLDKITK